MEREFLFTVPFKTRPRPLCSTDLRLNPTRKKSNVKDLSEMREDRQASVTEHCKYGCR